MNEKHKTIDSLWRWPLQTNLLAPSVACAWLAGLGAAYRLYIPPAYFLILAMTVWVLYTVDGLLDGLAGEEGDQRSPRSLFHRHHRRVLLPLVVAMGLGALGLVLREATATLAVAGGMLGALTALYLMHAQALRRLGRTLVPKEVLAGFLFAGGIMLPVLDLQGRFPFADPANLAGAWGAGAGTVLQWTGWMLLAMLSSLLSDPATPLLGILFATNCLLTALDETEAGSWQDKASALHVAPRLARFAPYLAGGLALCSLFLALMPAKASGRPLAFLVGLSAVLLLVVHALRKRDLIRGGAAAALFDCALLAPVGLMTLTLRG